MLEEYPVVPGDQQAGYWIARQVLCQGGLAAVKIVTDVRRRALEHPWSSRPLDPPRRIDFVEVAVRADAIFQFMGIAWLNRERSAIGSLRGAITIGVWPRG
jgi:hypothetical protein